MTDPHAAYVASRAAWRKMTHYPAPTQDMLRAASYVAAEGAAAPVGCGGSGEAETPSAPTRAGGQREGE